MKIERFCWKEHRNELDAYLIGKIKLQIFFRAKISLSFQFPLKLGCRIKEDYFVYVLLQVNNCRQTGLPMIHFFVEKRWSLKKVKVIGCYCYDTVL